MSSEAERKRIIDIFDAASDLTIATVREDGYPQANRGEFRQ